MVRAMLHVEVRVLPMAAAPLVIEADLVGADPGSPDEVRTVVGQEAVALATGDIVAIRLDPADPPAVPAAIQAVREADYLVLGPGSWYSSVIPHLLVPELARAICTAPGKRILTLNLAPTADETPAYTAARHLEVLADHAPALRLDVVVADPSFGAGDQHLAAYVASLGAELVVAPVGMRDGTPRHDPHLLASVYAGIMGL
jgi:uncharacterized cofD-like protein